MAVRTSSKYKRTESLSDRLKEYETTLVNNPKKGQSETARLKKSEKPESASTYLRKNLKDVLPRALHDVCQVRPADPIEYLAKWLYKAADSDLYFQDKALFEREKQKMEVKLKTEDTRRQSALERYKKHISELKLCIQKEEENKRISFVERPSKQLQKHGHPGHSKSDGRRKTIFDPYSDRSGASSQTPESHSSEPSFVDLRKLSEQRRTKRQPEGTDSVVSVRKDSSSSRTLHERSPSTRTSSSRTVSRMFSLSQKDEDSQASDSHPPGTKSEKTKHVAHKEKKPSIKPAARVKEDKGEVPRHKVAHHKKQASRTESSLTDVSVGIVPLGDRDKTSPDLIHVFSPTKQAQKAKRRPTKGEHDKRKSTLSDHSKYLERYKKGSLGSELVYVPGDEIREQLLEAKKFQQELEDRISQVEDFEEAPQEQLSLEEDGTTEKKTERKKRTPTQTSALTSPQGEQPIGRKTTETELVSTTDVDVSSSKSSPTIDKPDQGDEVKETRSGQEETAEEFDEVAGEVDSEVDISDEKLAEDGDQDEEKVAVIKSKRLKRKKRKSQVRSSIDTGESEQPGDDSEELEAQGKPSVIVMKLGKKKKARAKKLSVISIEDEDTEYEEEPRRSVSRRLSSGSKRPSLKQMEEENEEDDQQVPRAGKSGTIKSKPSTANVDRKSVARKQVKKKSPGIIIDTVADESAVEIDDESTGKQSDTRLGSIVESLDPKKRVKRRVRKQDRKSSDYEEGGIDVDKLAPLMSLSRRPSTDSSTEDIPKMVMSRRTSIKKGKPGGPSRKRSVAKRSFVEPVKESKWAKVRKLVQQLKQKGSLEDAYRSLRSGCSGTTEETLFSTLDSLGLTDESENYPFTPVECEWFLAGPRTLVCRHPILGDIRSRPVVVGQNFNGWPDRLNYNWRAFYDHEVYTVVEPYAAEIKLKRRPRDQ